MYKIGTLAFLLLLFSCHQDKVYYDDSYGPEILVYDSVFTTTVDDHGFFYFNPKASAGTNWISPYDFYNGEFYYRYEIIDYPSDTSFLLNLCIWSDIVGNWESWKETCCDLIEITGKEVYTTNSVPAEWWKLGEPVDFSRIPDFFSMGLAVWCADRQNMTDWPDAGNSCWAGRDYVLPLTLRLTIVAVAAGNTFSGWNTCTNSKSTKSLLASYKTRKALTTIYRKVFLKNR
jgi:hypothetical protein